MKYKLKLIVTFAQVSSGAEKLAKIFAQSVNYYVLVVVVLMSSLCIS